MWLEQFNFENAAWLWGIIIIPAIWLLYRFFYHINRSIHNLEAFADKELLPHLLKNPNGEQQSVRRPLVLWSLFWLCTMIAMAGPRWDFTDIETFTPDQSLVILLDLSQSMDATDVKPSRLGRARQEIDDILANNKNIKIGIIAFAADPHMVSPVTDDMQTIRNLLPSLTTDIVYIQGSRLSPALDMASHLLGFEPGNNKSVLIVSDGGFEDGSAINVASDMARQGLAISTMGVGTRAGAPIPDKKGNVIRQNNKTIISKLEADKLKAVSDAGGGQYIEANYLSSDTQAILSAIEKKTGTQEKTAHHTRYWEERFYVLLFPLMLLILFWFRKGYVFPVIIVLMLLPAQQSEAMELQNLFRNQEQLGKQEVDKGRYDSAAEKFNDAYRRGVAQYKAGKFDKAEESFRQSSRPEVSISAQYNLGNSLARQHKFEEAISAYENVLKEQPDNQNAQYNLDLVKRILEQQKQQEEQGHDNSDSLNQDNDNKSDNNEDSGNKQDSSGKPENQKDSPESKTQNANEQEDSEPKKSGDSGKPEGEDKPYQAGQSDEEKAQDQSAPQENPEKQQQTQQVNSSRKPVKTQQDVDADQWLNKITNDPKAFLQNQFSIESQRKNTKGGNAPW